MSQNYGGAQPYGGQPAYPAFTPPPVKTSTTGARVMTFVGIALLVITIVSAAIGVSRLISVFSGVLDESSSNSILLGREDSSEPVAFTADADHTYSIVGLTKFDRSVGSAGLTVTAPDGSDVPIRITTTNTTISLGDTTVTKLATFRTGEPGVYTVTATTDGTRSWDLGVVDESELDQLWSDLALGIVLVIIAAITFVVGLGLTIGGGIWWRVRSNNRRKVAATAFNQPGLQPPLHY